PGGLRARDGLGQAAAALGRCGDVELARQGEDRGAAAGGDDPGEAGLHVSALQKCDISPMDHHCTMQWIDAVPRKQVVHRPSPGNLPAAHHRSHGPRRCASPAYLIASPAFPSHIGLVEPVNLREYETAARDKLDPALYDYFAGGAQDEVTLAANEAAFRRLMLVPRVLTGAGEPSLETEILGRTASMPVLIAPRSEERRV